MKYESIIKIFPNPCNGIFYISNTLNEPIYCKKIVLYDRDGRCVLEKSIDNSKEYQKITLKKPPIGDFLIEIDFKFCSYYHSLTILRSPPEY